MRESSPRAEDVDLPPEFPCSAAGPADPWLASIPPCGAHFENRTEQAEFKMSLSLAEKNQAGEKIAVPFKRDHNRTGCPPTCQVLVKLFGGDVRNCGFGWMVGGAEGGEGERSKRSSRKFLLPL